MGLRTLALSTMVIISGSIFASNAKADVCDELMTNLINDQCAGSGCGVAIADGKLSNPTVRNGDVTTVRAVSKTGEAFPGIEEVSVEKGSDKTTLKMTLKDSNGRFAKTDYVFDSKSARCSLLQSSTAAPGELTSKVDYDREFCDAVNEAYAKLSSSEAAACKDLMTTMASAYEVRASELGVQKKLFRQSAPPDRMSAPMSLPPAKGSAGRALAQRDNCLATMAVMNQANPFLRKLRAANVSAPSSAFLFASNDAPNMSLPLSDTPQSSRPAKPGSSPVVK